MMAGEDREANKKMEENRSERREKRHTFLKLDVVVGNEHFQLCFSLQVDEKLTI
jgi:hypothetical protein